MPLTALDSTVLIWSLQLMCISSITTTQPTFTCSKLTIETLEQGLEYDES